MDQQASRQRKRVPSGRYNKYLKSVDPLENAPPSSKRLLLTALGTTNLSSFREEDADHHLPLCDDPEPAWEFVNIGAGPLLPGDFECSEETLTLPPDDDGAASPREEICDVDQPFHEEDSDPNWPLRDEPEPAWNLAAGLLLPGDLECSEEILILPPDDDGAANHPEEIYDIDQPFHEEDSDQNWPLHDDPEPALDFVNLAAGPLLPDLEPSEETLTLPPDDDGAANHQEDQPLHEEEDAPADKLMEEGDQPVFAGSRVSLGASLFLIMSFVMKYTITGECLKDLLNLISIHCPTDNLLPRSIASFKKWFEHIKHPLSIHKYCAFCHISLCADDVTTGICPNISCGRTVSCESGIAQFIELPISEQIKSFFSKPSFLADIQHRFTRTKSSDTAVEDIYDGKMYKSLSGEGGILSSPHNLSLLWNTDGIPCFKSSNMSLWPLFFQVNELPYPERIRPENMILAGLWFGRSKPSILSFTEPYVDSLQHLETVGVPITTPECSFHCKVCVIGGSADLPARSMVLNTTQYNGKYGCCKCLQPGKTHMVSARGHVHIFPFQADDPSGPERTDQGHFEDVAQAAATGKVSQGVKGPCFLMCLTYYSMISGTCIDYMHGVLLGVTKLLLSLWFTSEHSRQPFSLFAKIGLVDSRMKSLKPPNVVKRLPRSIKDHLKHFKASELRSWLLFYSLPLLKDLQDDAYFQHYLLFVNAIFLLLQESVSVADIARAEDLLTHFCCVFAAMYGERYVTCNVHQLLHLSDMVRDMGPLWVYSCFSFENANGRMLKLFNGTQHVDLQIVDGVNLLQNLPRLRDCFFKPGTEASDCLKSMEGSTAKKDRHLQGNSYIVGSCNSRPLSATERDAVLQFLGFVPVHYLCFNRMRTGKFTFHSNMYSREKLRNSKTIAYQDALGRRQFGQVAFFMQLYAMCSSHLTESRLCGCDLTLNVAMVHPHTQFAADSREAVFAEDEISHADIFFITALTPCDLRQLCVVPLEHILYMCVLVEPKAGPVVYACQMPNCIEMD